MGKASKKTLGAFTRSSQKPYPGAEKFIPDTTSFHKLETAAQDCRGCDLYKNATQAVFGDGTKKAKLLLVGEQPGNEEDLQGLPFVGPAGKLLDRIFSELNVERESVYITNIVKHFRHRRSGKRRIHEKPDARQVKACKDWLWTEIKLIRPSVVLCLGATAAQGVLGPKIRVQRDRQKTHAAPWAKSVFVTYHPSAVLRMTDPERKKVYEQLKADIELAYHMSKK